MPFSIYEGKEKVSVDEKDTSPRVLAKDRPIITARQEMHIMLEKEEENWFARELKRMQRFR